MGVGWKMIIFVKYLQVLLFLNNMFIFADGGSGCGVTKLVVFFAALWHTFQPRPPECFPKNISDIFS